MTTEAFLPVQNRYKWNGNSLVKPTIATPVYTIYLPSYFNRWFVSAQFASVYKREIKSTNLYQFRVTQLAINFLNKQNIQSHDRSVWSSLANRKRETPMRAWSDHVQVQFQVYRKLRQQFDVLLLQWSLLIQHNDDLKYSCACKGEMSFKFIT